MINPHNVFVADAMPALALPEQRSAYVFGAASALGEALLNQLLASSHYQRVYVSTTAALPSSVAHLYGVLASDTFALEDAAPNIDCVFVINEPGDHRTKNEVYAPLLQHDVPALLRQFSSAALGCQLRCLMASPVVSSAQLSSYFSSYSALASCMVYGPLEGKSASSAKGAYQFKPQADSWLDRLGAWVLNVLSNAAHSMLNPQSHAPLTAVKTAQRLVQRFDALPLQSSASITALTPPDLAAS